MSAERFSLDTNILVYALDGGGGLKHEVAAEIVDRATERDCWLTLQSLSEFYVAVTRKSLVSKQEAAAQVEDWLLLFPTLAVTPLAIRAALAHAEAGRASYWDALLVETAGEGGCAFLLSEDMTDGGRLGAVTVANPFGAHGMAPTAARILSPKGAKGA